MPKPFATALVWALLLQVAAAEAHSNDKRRVSETMVEAGNVTLTAERTKDAVTIRLADSRGSVTMTPAEAVEVGKTLAQADEVHQRLKDMPGPNDVVTHIGPERPDGWHMWELAFSDRGSTIQTVPTRGHMVTFKNSSTSNFSVFIAHKIDPPRRAAIEESEPWHTVISTPTRSFAAPLLDRAQVEEITPHLLKAVELAASIE